MYGFNIWEGCLSFLSISVALNFGSILVENKIRKLFDSDKTQENLCEEDRIGTIEEYRRIYCEKMQNCIQRVGKANKMHSELNE
ncbi:MAG: hypothetical protein Q4C43_04295 [Prevotella sp.]|nr:hypothetical protein [Prevotella sp.]